MVGLALCVAVWLYLGPIKWYFSMLDLYILSSSLLCPVNVELLAQVLLSIFVFRCCLLQNTTSYFKYYHNSALFLAVEPLPELFFFSNAFRLVISQDLCFKNRLGYILKTFIFKTMTFISKPSLPVYIFFARSLV